MPRRQWSSAAGQPHRRAPTFRSSASPRLRARFARRHPCPRRSGRSGRERMSRAEAATAMVASTVDSGAWVPKQYSKGKASAGILRAVKSAGGLNAWKGCTCNGPFVINTQERRRSGVLSAVLKSGRAQWLRNREPLAEMGRIWCRAHADGLFGGSYWQLQSFLLRLLLLRLLLLRLLLLRRLSSPPRRPPPRTTSTIRPRSQSCFRHYRAVR